MDPNLLTARSTHLHGTWDSSLPLTPNPILTALFANPNPDSNSNQILMGLFDLADVDGDGRLHETEWKKVFAGAGSRQKWKKIERLADGDRDGDVSLYEWLEFFDCDEDTVESTATELANGLGEHEKATNAAHACAASAPR